MTVFFLMIIVGATVAISVPLWFTKPQWRPAILKTLTHGALNYTFWLGIGSPVFYHYGGLLVINLFLHTLLMAPLFVRSRLASVLYFVSSAFIFLSYSETGFAVFANLMFGLFISLSMFLLTRTLIDPKHRRKAQRNHARRTRGHASRRVFDFLSRSPRAKRRPDVYQHYLGLGLSDSEIDYFREQMRPARDRILAIEANLPQTAKLRTIEERHNTIEICQRFFQNIVHEPRRITEATTFLYQLLPSLEDLSDKYNEINQHVAKSKQTYLILERCAATIDQVCQQITEEYLAFHQANFDDLEDEINLAHKYLDKEKL